MRAVKKTTVTWKN